MRPALAPYREAVANARSFAQRFGQVRHVGAAAIEAEGFDAAVGDFCEVTRRDSAPALLAEVIAARDGHCSLMPFGPIDGLAAGCEIRPLGRASDVEVGDTLLGRVIDAFGRPLDGGAPVVAAARRPLRSAPVNPMQRPRIDTLLETGVRAIDGLLSLGRGQRMGIFAGSGVGKSTLLGMIARHVHADVNVIALVGERGREVRDFVEGQLGADGLSRSVVVAAASDQPAPARVRATYAALTIAEHFRDEGRHVLLTVDSVTRFAMARREIGLAAGEPPTARGYTPSVFGELPQLCERCGTASSGGSITALMTVLVEGDDMNEPIADCMRSILDGHVVLSRDLAQLGHYPPVDVLQSASRVMSEVVTAGHMEIASAARRTLAVLQRNRQMVDLGAYEPGSNHELDRALAVREALEAWLRQSEGGTRVSETLEALARIVQ
jgi:flagellum-specific ATP synthase